MARRYARDPNAVWRGWTLRQLLFWHRVGQRGQWHEDELIIRYGGGGFKREEPKWGGGKGTNGSPSTSADYQAQKRDKEEQRRLLDENREKVAAIRARAAAGRVSGGQMMSARAQALEDANNARDALQGNNVMRRGT